ncbi:hypothetical protein BKA65DRAFT_555982 [Rhexocercosporidium sp. MPI-PUGE-AT-0058]|nr:hypothetical protein BKA65DRAFT_555982 [Rhexocercosporidium sp. MPI-PUGE-AT-0058]
MSFNSLSAELVLEVFLYVHPSAFVSLSLCCKRFHELVEPQLYMTFTQTRSTALQQFLRSLSIKPHRTKYVQHISAKAWDRQTVISTRFLDIDQSGPRVQPHVQIRELLPEEDFGKRHCEEWYQAVFTNRGWDAIIALLLVICTKLESVSLVLYNDSKYPFIERVLENARVSRQHSDYPQYLKSLSRVGLKPITASQRSRLYSMFLALDSVREFNGIGVQHGWNSPFEFNLKTPYVFTIAKVTFKNNAVYTGNGREFTDVLRWFHSMRSFRCEGTMGVSREYEEWTIMNGLINSKHCLEELTLSSMDHRFRDWHSAKTWSPITSLKGYTKLRSLELDSWMFLNATIFPSNHDYTTPGWISELLPDSLEQLLIRECASPDLAKFRTVFTSPGLVAGNLRMLQFIYQLPEDFEHMDETEWPALEEITRNHGIALTRELHLR